jgi:hypothetical protein
VNLPDQAVHQHRRQFGVGGVQCARQGLEQCEVPLGQNKAKLVEQTADLVGLHDAHLHKLSTQANIRGKRFYEGPAERQRAKVAHTGARHIEAAVRCHHPPSSA